MNVLATVSISDDTSSLLEVERNLVENGEFCKKQIQMFEHVKVYNNRGGMGGVDSVSFFSTLVFRHVY